MKHSRTIAILVLAALSGCSVEEIDNQPVPGMGMKFSASFGDIHPTRTALLNGGQVLWDAGDEIDVYYGASSQGKFVSLNTEPAAGTEFVGDLSNYVYSESGSYIAVYPHSAANSYDGSTLTVELPDVQNGREGTFDSNLFISIAKSSGSDLFFYNLCGGVEFSVDEPEVKSVTLKGNNGETLAGKVKVLLDGDNKPYVSEVIDGKTEITLTAPGGKYFEKDKLYYIVALPAVLEKGFTLTFKKQPGGAVRVSEKTVEVKRSVWGTLYRADKGVKYDRPIEFADPEVQRVCLANWDSDGDGYFLESEAEAVTSFGTAFKGSAIRSFYEISYFTAVQGLENEAFAGCSSLAAFVVPDNITSIGGRVFEDCPSLSVILADKDNINFKTVDGILYNAGMTELVRYPQAKSGRRYVLPETVANIVPGALQGCSSLQAVFISHPAPPVCQDMTFGDSPEVIYVLDSALDNYRTWEVWNRWSSKYIGLAADEIHFIDFKDPVFETYMLGSYDANGDGIISYKEVKGIVELNLVGMGLSSIDGLALMPDLERLDIRNNPNVKSIDLSGNPKLHYIDVSGTGIREFDISKCCYKFDYIGGLSGTCKALVISGQYAMNNYKGSNMKAVVDGSAFTTEDWSRDGEVVTLQNHTRGPGLSLLLMGDGYIDQDIESGLFDRQMRLTYNALFSVEPYITLKDYFDVYYKITLSGSRVFDGNTYFRLKPASNDRSPGNMDYAFSASSTLLTQTVGPTSFKYRLVVLNGLNASGVTYYSYSINSSSIRSINGVVFIAALDSYSGTLDEYEATVIHETGGHLIGILADEYGSSTPTSSQLSTLAGKLSNGIYHANISTSNDQTVVPWSLMFNDGTYSSFVGMFEGGNGYSSGVWRSTSNSVMRSHYQTRQFNAWSRWLIYKNLMMIMGLPYSFDEFRAMDARNIDSASFTRAPELPEDWTDKMPLAGDCIAIEESR